MREAKEARELKPAQARTLYAPVAAPVLAWITNHCILPQPKPLARGFATAMGAGTVALIGVAITDRAASHGRLPRNATAGRGAAREKNWKRWGPYLSERQWGTVREDYSADGDCWNYFPHDHARSRAYRWGEDGMLGFTDRECRLCFAPAFWNGADPILKERFFGLTNAEGNHGEDVKEAYFYLDGLPTHSYKRGSINIRSAPFPTTN